MKFLSTCFLGLLLLAVLTIVASQDEAPKKSGGGLPKRPNARHLPKGSTTTTPATSSEDDLDDAEDDAENADNGDDEDKEGDEAPATSTEPAKKIGPIIRPFRSNDDLLNALKRRQQNVKSNAGATKKAAKVEPKSEEPADEEQEAAPAEKPKPVEKSTGRRGFAGRSRPAAPAPVSESSDEPKKRANRSRYTLNKN